MSKNTVLPKKEEKQFLELGKQVFLNDFPNPERKGCPESKVIKQIAAGKVAVDEENKWVDHFTACSPCSREFSDFRRQFQRRKRIRVVGVTTVLAVAIFACIWLVVGRNAKINSSAIARNSGAGALRTEVLDLRNWSAVRSDGGTSNASATPLSLQRANALLVVYLPLGSQPGKYEVQIVTGKNRRLLDVSGVARIENGNTVLRVRINLSKLIPGQYSLGVRQPPWEWRYYKSALR